MSTKALSWAVDQKTGGTGKKCILMLLSDLADEQFTCYPSREYLSERAEMSPSTVSRIITDLIKDGRIRSLRRARRRGGRSTNRYLIMVYGPDTPLPEVDDWVSEFDPDGDEPAGQGNGDAAAPLPVDDDEPAGQSNSDAAAPLVPDGNGADSARSTVADCDVSNKEKTLPARVNEDRYTPPPRSTHASGAAPSAAAVEQIEHEIGEQYLDAARKVLRETTVGVDVLRLPTDAERGRLVDRVIDHLRAGWSADQLVARLLGMGPLTTVASVYAVLTTRLRDVGEPPPAPPHERLRLRWCGDPGCDPVTRQRLDDDGRPLFVMLDGQRTPSWCGDCSGR